MCALCFAAPASAEGPELGLASLALPGYARVPVVAAATRGVQSSFGMGYGLVSGLTAAAVAAYWRLALYGRIASRIYIAWSAAAIVLPIVAGRLFDLTGGYGAAVLLAAGGNAVGVLVALGLPRPHAPASSTAP